MPASRKGSGKKEKKKTPKQQIQELTEQNEALTSELERIRGEHDALTLKLAVVATKILGGVDRKQFRLPADLVDAASLPTDTLSAMLDALIVKRQVYDQSVESRADELERRVTTMSRDLARMTMKTQAYEDGLHDVLHTSDLETIKDRVYQLQLIAGIFNTSIFHSR